jgi:hypothetical protein
MSLHCRSAISSTKQRGVKVNRLIKTIVQKIGLISTLISTAACTSATESEHGLKIRPRALASAGCPDLSGHYTGTGALIDDDANHRPSPIRDLDNVFPPLSEDEWNSLQKNYQHDSRGLEKHADSGLITADGTGEYMISLFYGHSLIGTYIWACDPSNLLSMWAGQVNY